MVYDGGVTVIFDGTWPRVGSTYAFDSGVDMEPRDLQELLLLPYTPEVNCGSGTGCK